MDCQIRLLQGYNTTVGSYGNNCAQADCLPLRCKYAEMLHDVARCLIHSSILRRDVWEPAGSSTISSMWKTHHFVDHFPIGENSLAFPQLTARAFYVFLRLFVSPKRLGFLDLSGSFWQVASMVCPLNLDHHTWTTQDLCGDHVEPALWRDPNGRRELQQNLGPLAVVFRWYSRKRLWWRWWTSDIPISNRNMIRSDKSWDFGAPYFQTKPSENQQTGFALTSGFEANTV